MVELKDKITNLLQTLYNAVYSEECGDNVRISEEFTSKEIKKLMRELKIPPGSNLCKADMEWAVKDFFHDYPQLKTFDLTIVNAWLKPTDLNGAAKKIFRNIVKERLKDDRT